MSDRIFKGHLLVTEEVANENKAAFPEAACSFSKAHRGGLKPFEILCEILFWIDGEEPPVISDHAHVKMINGSLWVSGYDSWIKIDPDGNIEVGTSGE